MLKSTSALSSFEGTTLNAVSIDQSPAPHGLGSWDAFAYGLLPNRLAALGQASMHIENYTEEKTKCINFNHNLGKNSGNGLNEHFRIQKRNCANSSASIETSEKMPQG